MSKDDVINIMKNSDLKKNVSYYNCFSLYTKIGETTYCERKRDNIK